MTWRDLPALSINQPWAWLIAAGHKDIENRNWTTEFRGEFLIHTGLKVDKDAVNDLEVGLHPVDFAPVPYRRRVTPPPSYDQGGIIGIAELVGVVTKRTGGAENPWFVGRYGFVLRNARAIEFTACVGALGFFKPDFSRQYTPRSAKPSRAAKPVEPEQGDLLDA